MERLNMLGGNLALRHDRRGVLLLVVLSLLTLFMMLGATYLVIGARARATARAFANAVAGPQAVPNAAVSRAFVDEAFLRVVRGNALGTSGTVSNSDTLLGDKYGTAAPQRGSVIGTPSGTVIITLTGSGSGLTDAAEKLAGRVLTFTLPGLTHASVRILRAEPSGSNVTLYVPSGPTLSGVNLTASAIDAAATAVGSSATHFVINGREFTGSSSDPNEPWDGFDSNNNFLANPLSPASRASFSVSGAAIQVDNDGDGTADSGWLDIGLPPIIDATGQTLYPRAAILVTDLDGRLNINAHGGRNDLDNGNSLYPSNFASGSNALAGTTTGSTSFTTTSGSLALYPRGLGYGPAEIAIESAGLFEAHNSSSANMLSGADGVSDQNADPLTKRLPPKIGMSEGRYGGRPQTSSTANSLPSINALPRPGNPYVDDSVTATLQSWIAASGKEYASDPRRYGAPPDLKGRMRVFVDDYGQPVYFKPYWSTPGARPEYIDDETVDDPYEVDLSRLGPRTGAVLNPVARGRQVVSGSAADYSASGSTIPDSLYTAGDLEGLLRIYDIDSPKLPRRLAANCGTRAGASRLMLTTDSWDSPVITGTLRATVSTLIKSATAAVPLTGTSGISAYEMFSPETLMGHKFDLNRPFHPTDPSEPNDAVGIAERQTFAKQLYSLLYCIAGGGLAVSGSTAEQLAQWSINVVDFRDRDSVMTGFEYDNNLTNGWTVNGDLSANDTDGPDRAVVWGVERPEILLTESVCWHDRNTDDATFTGNSTVVANDPAARDNDLDQQRRPQGAFHFELYSPWESQLAEYGSSGMIAVRRTVQGGTSSLLRGEPLPIEMAAGSVAAGTGVTGTHVLGRFDVGAQLSLSATTPGGYPVWRVVTLKSGTSSPTVTAPELALAGSVWRSFYFVQPPVSFVRTGTNGDIASGSNAIAFWPAVSATSTISLAPHVSKTFGTGTSASAGGTASTVVMDAMFLNPTTKSDTTSTVRAGTLTEPLITLGTNASYDPYAVLHSQAATATATFPLATPNDNPLDNLSFPTSGISTLQSGSKKTLFQNGRHSNYFLLHLQRLTNPTKQWNKDSNPYVTIDTLPVDLFVFNSGTNSLGTAGNYDEPTQESNNTFSMLEQRTYDDGASASVSGAAARVSLERGNTQVSATNDLDIWSARVTTTGTSDAMKLLSIVESSTTAVRITWPGGTSDGILLPLHVGPATSRHTLGSLATRFGGGTSAPSRPFPWLFWPNRPFVSSAELASVPTASAFNLLRAHATANGTGSDKLSTGWFGHLPRFFEPTIYDSGTIPLPSPWDLVGGRNASSGNPMGAASPSLWDAVHVPTPFNAGFQSVPTSGTAALLSLGLENRPYQQLPLFREPGRINVNTITGSNVWSALIGSGTAGTAIQPWSTPASPASTQLEALSRFLTVSGTTSFIDTYSEAARSAKQNTFFRYQTVNRMANLVTVRSNVFAVWVTVGYSTTPTGFIEAGIDTGEIRRHRGFYIYDRSIPVGFDPGLDLNVRDAILLRRTIQ